MPTLFSDARRLSDVSGVLIRHGLGYVVHHANLQQPFWRKLVPPSAPAPQTIPQQARLALEELGGAYLKLGQLLSIRPDLVPQEYCEEFKRLQDAVPPFPASIAREIIATELGKSVAELFKTFDDEPLGSASVAQVHRALLLSGEHVVVKVQRPEAADHFYHDIDIMRRIAEAITKRNLLSDYEPLHIVDEFERSTRKELDFKHEAQAIRRFEQMFRFSKHVVIPRVHHATKNVLVMTELVGTKLSDLGNHTVNRARLVGILVDAMIEQIFEHSFFHADLHPGNIMVLPNNRIGLIDFGITGTLTPQMRTYSIAMYAAVANNDSDAAVRALQNASLRPEIDLPALRRDVHDIFLEWQDEQHRLPTSAFHRMFRAASKHGVKLPAELVLVGKALLTLEGTCQTLDPTFNFVDYGFAHFNTLRSKELRQTLSPAGLRKRLVNTAQSLATFSDDALAIMARLKRGEVKIDIDDTDIRHLGTDLNTSSNRLSFALVISALLVFSALVVNITPLVKGISVYTVMGLALAFLTVILLIVSIRREGRKGIDTHEN